MLWRKEVTGLISTGDVWTLPCADLLPLADSFCGSHKEGICLRGKAQESFCALHSCSLSQWPKYLLARSSSICIAKGKLTPRCHAKSKAQDGAHMFWPHQPRQTLHWFQWGFGTFSKTVAQNSLTFFQLIFSREECLLQRLKRKCQFLFILYSIILAGLLSQPLCFPKERECSSLPASQASTRRHQKAIRTGGDRRRRDRKGTGVGRHRVPRRCIQESRCQHCSASWWLWYTSVDPKCEGNKQIKRLPAAGTELCNIGDDKIPSPAERSKRMAQKSHRHVMKWGISNEDEAALPLVWMSPFLAWMGSMGEELKRGRLQGRQKKVLFYIILGYSYQLTFKTVPHHTRVSFLLLGCTWGRFWLPSAAHLKLLVSLLGQLL